MSIFRARPHTAEAAANTATPNTHPLRRPNISPSAPPTSSNAANLNAYDSTTHCTSAIDAWKAFCNAGSATLTTVPSMNAMLDPRIVTASTIRPLACEFELSFRMARFLIIDRVWIAQKKTLHTVQLPPRTVVLWQCSHKFRDPC